MQLDSETLQQLSGRYDHLAYQGQWGRRGQWPVEFGQIRRTPKQVGRSSKWVPEFASDDGQLRAVLVHAAVGYCFLNKKPSAEIIDDLAYLDRLARDRAAHNQAIIDGSAEAHWNNMAKHLVAVEAAGGSPFALVAAVAYRAWRLRWHDHEIARELGMQRQAVTSLLWKLKHIATTLGFPTCTPRRERQLAVSDDAIVEAWNAGETVGHIKALGCSVGRIRRVLRSKGLYTWKRRIKVGTKAALDPVVQEQRRATRRTWDHNRTPEQKQATQAYRSNWRRTRRETA